MNVTLTIVCPSCWTIVEWDVDLDTIDRADAVSFMGSHGGECWRDDRECQWREARPGEVTEPMH